MTSTPQPGTRPNGVIWGRAADVPQLDDTAEDTYRQEQEYQS